MKAIVRRFRSWLCHGMGHSFDDISLAIFQIKIDTANNDMNATIKCQRCGETFVFKDSPLAPNIKDRAHELR